MKRIKGFIALLLVSVLMLLNSSLVFADTNILSIEEVTLEDGTIICVEILKPEIALKQTRGFNEYVTLRANVYLGSSKIDEVETFVDYYALSDGSRGINDIDVDITPFGEWNNSYYSLKSKSSSKWSYSRIIQNKRNGTVIAQLDFHFNVSVQAGQIPKLSLS
ncbi:MAG: hypothetical protein E7234_10410 [Lachnospiraceae bacterium]|nr:hypothetical protein [Lachnospiraceae bacterium]